MSVGLILRVTLSAGECLVRSYFQSSTALVGRFSCSRLAKCVEYPVLFLIFVVDMHKLLLEVRFSMVCGLRGAILVFRMTNVVH